MPELQNGHHNGSTGNISYGESIVFTCDSKHRLIGANNVTCGDFGTWSAGPPVCELKGSVLYLFV